MLILSTTYLLPINIDNQTPYNELLSHSQIYIDNNKSETIKSIQKRKFEKNSKKLLGYGYSPSYAVWIRFTLTNRTDKTVEKIIEYGNPLTSYVEFYEDGELKKRDGLLQLSKERKSLNPILRVKLQPHQTKTYYLKVSSKITTLRIKLNLWSLKEFNHQELQKQTILALFFGAMGIIILYNSTIYILTREESYFYYVLFLVSVSFHHLMYKGVAGVYLFSNETMKILIDYSSVIVAMPTISLALFTQHILRLKQYPKINKILNALLLLYPIFIVVIEITHSYQFRSLFFIIILLYLFAVTLYALIRKNKTAPLLFLAWLLFVSGGIAMYLSSLGVESIFDQLPYYPEFSLVAIVLIFSWLVSSKIKMLQEERLNAQKNRFLLKEFNHRVKNNMQIILSMLTLQKNGDIDQKSRETLKDLERRVVAISDQYTLLSIKEDSMTVDMYNYFTIIVNNLKKSFQKEIKTNINATSTMNSKEASYVGLIVNEALTNAFKYSNCDTINIVLKRENSDYLLTIQDNGVGFSKRAKDGLGLMLIDTLATLQLNGQVEIKKQNGVKITIRWREDEERY